MRSFERQTYRVAPTWYFDATSSNPATVPTFFLIEPGPIALRTFVAVAAAIARRPISATNAAIDDAPVEPVVVTTGAIGVSHSIFVVWQGYGQLGFKTEIEMNNGDPCEQA